MASTSRRQRLLGLVTALPIAATLLIAAPASAAAPQPITIDLVTTFTVAGEAPTGVFVTTSGSGVLCASGTSVWYGFKGEGWPSHAGALEVTIPENFTRADGSGSFVLRELFHFNPNGPVQTWIVQSGTGRYQRLTGHGTSVTNDVDESHNHSVLTGFVIH